MGDPKKKMKAAKAAEKQAKRERKGKRDGSAPAVLAITTKRGEMTKRSDQHGARAAVTK
jgi:hypothetical protein